MSLTAYHKKYINQSDSEIQNRINEKEEELKQIFAEVELKTNSDIIKIAVMGCGDKRFVHAHKMLFEGFLSKPLEITTMDITIDHLQAEHHILQHDCTLPIPDGPYDITFAHVLLRFIETEKQWDLIQNSFHVLKTGGLAIHLLDKVDYETKSPHLPNGLFSVPLDKWKSKLEELGITYKSIPVKYGTAFILFKK